MKVKKSLTESFSRYPRFKIAGIMNSGVCIVARTIGKEPIRWICKK